MVADKFLEPFTSHTVCKYDQPLGNKEPSPYLSTQVSKSIKSNQSHHWKGKRKKKSTKKENSVTESTCGIVRFILPSQ